ncbi:glucuronate isomerase [Anaerosporobacter sp.]|uniref:glucuronate isomerase n=1 Tax=Anaerosporobacter sp. TaxID=1872529 RepID=UPI00286EB89A|nr:glucuronate isomerase [Anaerosporobacter sp.]
MKPFIHDDFILHNKIAQEIYHSYAKDLPIIDFHNHLSAQEIYQNNCYRNLSEAWLGGDHYKWRAMRANGLSEEYITGNAEPFEKFLAWTTTIQYAIGNPLYHWTHLELKRYFDIDETLSVGNAKEIWDKCNEKLQSSQYSVRNLLRKQNIEALCTTDDPIDSLVYHKKLKETGFEIQVLPTFRPELAVGIEKEGFTHYIEQLSEVTDLSLDHISDLLDALKLRLSYFIDAGCRISDHSLEDNFFEPTTYEEVDAIYRNKLNGAIISNHDCAKYRGWLLTELAKEYANHGIVMQLHIGALRNNSTRILKNLGSNVGLDSLNDFNYATQLSALLDAMDETDQLPKTILYYLNPKDAEMLATMAGNFQANSIGIKGKVQLGSAWWFCDHMRGMEHQMDVVSEAGLLSTFIGMLTDSRSFLSFPRHEYFRRILCNKLGTFVERGEYPEDMKSLELITQNVCYYNARNYLDL